MIDAASLSSNGDTGSGDYTTVAWVTGVGKGLTVAPAGGDTGKTLFFANTGYREINGRHTYYGTYGGSWSATPHTTDGSAACLFDFYESDPSGYMWSISKFLAYPLRCVRS